MGIDKTLTQFQPISGNTFLNRPSLLRGTQAGGIADCHGDFDTAQWQFGEREVRQRTDRRGGCATALERLTNPVAQVAVTVHPIELVKSASADERAGRSIEDSELEAASPFPPLLTHANPRQRWQDKLPYWTVT